MNGLTEDMPCRLCNLNKPQCSTNFQFREIGLKSCYRTGALGAQPVIFTLEKT
jgi:hypothetical protein